MTQPAHQQPGHQHLHPAAKDWAGWDRSWTKHVRGTPIAPI
jgi:hypothetical protein